MPWFGTLMIKFAWASYIWRYSDFRVNELEVVNTEVEVVE